jgi:hypothetical protein
VYSSEAPTTPPSPLLLNLMLHNFRAVHPLMGVNEDNGLFQHPYFSKWRYITLLVQIDMRFSDKYKLRPAIPPTVLLIVFTSRTAEALPFAMSRWD